ncbi:MAG: ABC transporter substrate-binding protein [Pseudomonadota bacterium]
MTRFTTSLIIALYMCTSVGNAASLDEIKKRGTLRVAVAPLSPFVIRDEDGSLSGLEIDAMEALSAETGLSIEFVERPFCELAEAVVSGAADMIASGYSNMPERRGVLDFSLPYHDTEYFLVVSREKAKKAKTLRGLNSDDVKIGYQLGGVSGMVATGEFSGSALKGFSSFPEIVDALRSGEVDGAVMFEPYLGAAEDIKKYKYRVPHEFALTRTIEAYAVEKGSDELRDRLNEFVISRDIQGYWDDLEEKWFADDALASSAPPPTSCKSTTPQG